MMDKIVLFAFNGELMCFVHVLLNAKNLAKQGHEVKIVVEGSATALIPQLADPTNPMGDLYSQVKEDGLIAGACRACSAKMKVLPAVEAEGLTLLDDMKGHPSMSRYLDDGYRVITF